MSVGDNSWRAVSLLESPLRERFTQEETGGDSLKTFSSGWTLAGVGVGKELDEKQELISGTIRKIAAMSRFVLMRSLFSRIV